jgi:predicted nucleic acid-binding protein
LTSEFEELCITPFVLYEILIGQAGTRHFDMTAILKELTVLSCDEKIMVKAASLYQALRKENKLIDHFDILIAVTAIVHEMPLATLNRKHFERIKGLTLVDSGKKSC